MAKEINSELENRLTHYADVIASMASHDFTFEAQVKGDDSLFDQVSIGLNMLREEIISTMVSKSDLEKINNELNQFAYIVSHDLKAPLRAISSLVMFLEEDLGELLEDEVKENFSLLKGRVKRMESLINGILEYSRVGRLDNTVQRVDINKIVEHVVDFLSSNEKLEVKIHNRLPTLYGNPTRIQQVIQNVISNSIKYCDKDTCKIDISSHENDNNFEITISDNGPGISEKDREKVFGIFQTLQSRDTIESTGVGLSIVKKIIEDSGGKVWFDSNEGKDGVKFSFTWIKDQAENGDED